MEIRELGAGDAALYWPLRLRALREEPQSFGSSYEESRDRPLDAVAERFRQSAAEGGFTLGAFERDGDAGEARLVGTATFAREQGRKSQHLGSVYGVYVAPEARGKGYARALMEALIARARIAPDLEMLTLAVTTGNIAASALYHALGFVAYGRQPHALKLADGVYLDEDLLYLTLTNG